MRCFGPIGLIALLSACGPETTDAPATQAAAFSVEPTAAETAGVRQTFADGSYEPLRGDPERKALLDSLRPKVESTLGLPVEFMVDTLRVSGDWAFAILEPVKAGGAPLTILDTRLKDEEGERDGLRTEAIWRKESGAWALKEHAIGATDVWYEPFCDEAPRGLIPVCAGRQPK